MDMTMLQLLNARERAEDDYADLFQRTDPRFKFVGIKRPEGSRTCTIEAIWLPDSETTQNGNVAAPSEPAVQGEKRDYDAFHSPAPTENNGTAVNGKQDHTAADTPMETSFPSNDIVGNEHATAIDPPNKVVESAAGPADKA